MSGIKDVQKRTLELNNFRFEKYILYETASYYYLVASTSEEEMFRMLKIDRGVERPTSLSEILHEDQMDYTKQEISDMLEMIDDGNKSSGGLNQVVVACGIFGFIRFLDCYYITLITQRKKAGKIGPNFIYSVKAAEVFAIKPKEKSGKNPFLKLWSKVSKKMNQTQTDTAESKYMGLYQFLDITKDFFFSYSYDLTHSLQHNCIMSSKKAFPPPPFQHIFEWNNYQMEEFRAVIGDLSASYWVLPFIHGSFQQKMFSIFGRTLYMTLVARRSRHYAGTRYLKRGVNVHGKVANDCEIEEILQHEDGTLATYSSYIQQRGSIPTYWAQETSVTMPKPPILISRVDPAFCATQEHFADLFVRYGSPIIVLDLVKQVEKKQRESLIGDCFRQGVQIVNEYIADEHKVRYCALDFSRVSKSSTSSSSTSISQLDATAPASASRRRSSTGIAGPEWAAFENNLNLGPQASFSSPAPSPQKNSPPRSPFEDPNKEEGKTFDDAALHAFASLNGLKGNQSVFDNVNSGNDKNKSGPPKLMGKVDVFQELQEIATWSLSETALFCSTTSFLDRDALISPEMKAEAYTKGFVEQRGVLRTNCVDCLDRTNVGQFALGVRFLSSALRVMGLSDVLVSEPSNPLVMTLMDMYSEMGDRIALQYGGSEAHSKMGHSGSSLKGSGELLTSIKRYYSNAFTDRVKQDAINLFLGHFVPSLSKTSLWELESDYHLHNKYIRAPLSYADEILFSQTIKDEESKARNNNVIQEVGITSNQYLIKSDIAGEVAERTIARKETRKSCFREKSLQIDEALQEWWRLAVHEHDARRLWMFIPQGSYMSEKLRWKAFDRVYKPSKLTSFDSIITEDEFSSPIIIESLNAANTKQNWRKGSISDDKLRGALESEELLGGAGDGSVGMFGKIGMLAGQIGMRARHLVGGFGFLRRDEAVDSSLNSTKSPSTMTKGHFNINYEEDDMYRSYVDAAVRLSVEMKGYGSCQHEFEECLKELTIDADDALRMRDLSKNASTAYMVDSGPYAGMRSTALASAEYTGPLLAALVAIEDAFDCSSLQLTSPRNSNFDRDLILSEESLSRLEIISKVNHFPPGLELELQIRSSQFLLDQAMYARELATDRICRTTASLSTPRTFSKYLSYYEKESLAMQYGSISTIVRDLSQFTSVTSKAPHLVDFDQLLARLKPLHEVYETISSPPPFALKEEICTEIIQPTLPTASVIDVRRDMSSVSNHYDGFIEISYDLYAKESNPYFKLNEVAVISFLRSKKHAAARRS